MKSKNLLVIPAEAGIQHCQNPEGMTHNISLHILLSVVLPELIKGLDSRLRGNDKGVVLEGFHTEFQQGESSPEFSVYSIV